MDELITDPREAIARSMLGMGTGAQFAQGDRPLNAGTPPMPNSIEQLGNALPPQLRDAIGAALVLKGKRPLSFDLFKDRDSSLNFSAQPQLDDGRLKLNSLGLMYRRRF